MANTGWIARSLKNGKRKKPKEKLKASLAKDLAKARRIRVLRGWNKPKVVQLHKAAAYIPEVKLVKKESALEALVSPDGAQAGEGEQEER